MATLSVAKEKFVVINIAVISIYKVHYHHKKHTDIIRQLETKRILVRDANRKTKDCISG